MEKSFKFFVITIGFLISLNSKAQNAVVETCDKGRGGVFVNCSHVGNLVFPSYLAGELKFYAADMEAFCPFQITSAEPTQLYILADLLLQKKVNRLVIDRKHLNSVLEAYKTYKPVILDRSEILAE